MLSRQQNLSALLIDVDFELGDLFLWAVLSPKDLLLQSSIEIYETNVKCRDITYNDIIQMTIVLYACNVGFGF